MVTPQTNHPALAEALGLKGAIVLKREDLHPYGSHKGRSIPLMIETHAAQGARSFVISSSGNAAIAAAQTIIVHNAQHDQDPLTLTIFVGRHIDAKKLKVLQAISYKLPAIRVEQVDNPKQQALLQEKNDRVVYLRQSTDDVALLGYATLAHELATITDLSAIFVPTSSGTTAQALGEALIHLAIRPQIHIVQTAACHPMAGLFDSQAPRATVSLASAIVDRVAHRRDRVAHIVRETRGSGWIALDDDIRNAITLTKQTTDVELSPNSALAIAGIHLAIQAGWSWDGLVAALITGP